MFRYMIRYVVGMFTWPHREDVLYRVIRTIYARERTILMSLAKLQDAVARNLAASADVATKLGQLAEQLRNSANDQAAIDVAADHIDAATKGMLDALAAINPPAPPPE